MKTLKTIAIVLILFIGAAGPSIAAEQKAYASPEAAVDAFIAAIRAYDLDALVEIFGDESKRLFVSEDPVADKNQREDFLRLYDESHELKPQGETRILVVGSDPWPLPIPLVRSKAGWTFDTGEGLEEIIDRRIGRNELSAIQTILAVGDAQREYFQADRDGDDVLEYAQSFRSSEGSKNGLYWQTGDGEPQSPIGEFVAEAAAEGYGPSDSAYHGYHYRLLPTQYVVNGNQIAGFAVLAFPAAYGDSGVMTFLLSHEGVVYEKDLGKNTAAEAAKIESFNPKGWKQVSEKDRTPIP